MPLSPPRSSPSRRPRPVGVRLLVAGALAAAGDCTETGLQSDFVQRVAVTAGDFDDVAAPLKRRDVAHDVFEGLISTATWDEDFDPGRVALKVEDLFLGNDGAGQLGRFEAVFVGSGTRGFGARQYNGLDPDDLLVQDPRVAENTARYVGRGNTLLATDWAYELVETVYPEAIDFLGDDPVLDADGRWTNLDAAQKGVITRLQADVTDPDLAEALGMSVVALEFPYSNFAIIEDVGPDTTVYLRGDVEYLPDLTAEPVALTGVPLLVGFEPPGGGRVIYASFHVDAQTPAVMDTLLEALVGTFEQEQTNVAVP